MINVLILILLGFIYMFTITNQALLTTISCPAIGAVIIWLLPQSAHNNHRSVALWITLVTLISSLMIWGNFDNSCSWFQQIFSVQIEWNGTIWVSCPFGIDGFSLWMILLTTALFPLCVICSWNTVYRSSQSFYIILLILETMLCCLWSVNDYLAFYIFYESVLIPMFLCICIAGSRERKILAAYQLVLYTLIGSLLLLPCLLFIYTLYGSTSLYLVYQNDCSLDRQLVLWWGFFFAFAVKIPIVPLHLWLPEAHVEASTAGSVILAGVLLKLGGYGFLRLCLPFLPEACSYYSPFIFLLSLLAIIYTSLTTLRMVDLKKIIAYSSVAHMSFVMLTLFSFNELSYSAALFFMISHGIISPALFLCVGILYDRYHTKYLKYLGGVAYTMPLFSIWFFIFTAASIGLPLFPSFIAEFMCLTGIFYAHTLAACIASFGLILSACYSLWAYARVVHGLPKQQATNLMCDLCRREWFMLLPLFIICIWLGILPSVMLETIEHSSFFWVQLSD
uniref:NADH-ubiquinone oxidoreductase chain 4 n=1 Tax=Jenufa minuta TaxID=993092 RepID=A0A6G7IT06_JENMI|nr:NADH dehydrogenase subunit 4 [Jenufa minuta]QII41635.1 NADH dehydrogenase subunit 4 [Jenufa minuta]